MKDQRQMLGVSTAAEARALAESHGETPWPERFTTGILDTGESVAAYVNEGRWVATCPACNGGIAVATEWTYCFCLDCGRSYAAQLPSKPTRAKAEGLLLARGSSRNANWYPGRESLDDLRAENARHGVDFTVEAP